MIKNKGSIVPKWIVKAVEKKSQHLVKFGCEVEIVNNKVTALEGGDIIVFNGEKYCNLKKNKRLVKGFIFGKIKIIGKHENTFVKMSDARNIQLSGVSVET